MSIKSQSRLFVIKGFEIADDVPSSTRGDLDRWVDINDRSARKGCLENDWLPGGSEL
jgi:hypothetical protein